MLNFYLGVISWLTGQVRGFPGLSNHRFKNGRFTLLSVSNRRIFPNSWRVDKFEFLSPRRNVTGMSRCPRLLSPFQNGMRCVSSEEERAVVILTSLQFSVIDLSSDEGRWPLRNKLCTLFRRKESLVRIVSGLFLGPFARSLSLPGRIHRINRVWGV